MAGTLSVNITEQLAKSLSIEIVSFRVLLNAYKDALSKQTYSLDWEEDQFSQYLIGLMDKSDLTSKHKLVINPERKLNDINSPPTGNNHPNKLPRIDISIASWEFVQNDKLEYFFEAKNLYQYNCMTKIASNYYNRYIDTGIENFRIKKYYSGSLVGYILCGEIKHIIKKINIQLKEDRKYYEASNCLTPLKNINLIENYPHCYESIHRSGEDENLQIKHILLDFLDSKYGE